MISLIFSINLTPGAQEVKERINFNKRRGMKRLKERLENRKKEYKEKKKYWIERT